MQDITFKINGIEELSKVSDLLISWRDKSNIIAFYGNMGAGNSTIEPTARPISYTTPEPQVPSPVDDDLPF